MHSEPTATRYETNLEQFDPNWFAPLYAAEEKHFWFRSRNRILGDVFRRATASLPDGYRVLEVGCGTGVVLQALVAACSRGTVYGMDLYVDGLLFARRRTAAALVAGDVRRPPSNKRFHAIGAFDVIEHIADDMEILRHFRELLMPGGRLVVTVPAHQSLWSYLDVAAGHKRRYGPADLAAKLRETGFELEYLSPFMSALFPVMWIRRKVATIFRRTDTGPDGVHAVAESELKIVPGVNAMLLAATSFDRWLIARGLRVPFGTSLIAVARRA